MDNGGEITDRQVALQWYNHLCEKWGSYYDRPKARQEISSIYDDNFKRHFEKLFGTQASDTGDIFHCAELTDREENPFVAPAKDHLLNVVLNGLNEELLQVIHAYKFKVRKNYLLACVDSGNINSFCTRVPFSDYYLILMDSLFMIFCSRLAKIIAMSTPVQDEEAISKYSFKSAAIKTHLKNNPIMITRLIDTFSGLLFFDKPYGKQKWFISKDGLPLYVSLLHCMEFFALSHEYGHIICNHFDDSYAERVAANEGEPIDEISFKYSQELEADNLGLTLCVLNLKKRYRDAAAWTSGIYVFFRLHQIIEDLEILLKKVLPNHVSTHPSASIRLKAILDYIEMKDPEDLKPRVLHSLRNLDVILDFYKEILVKYFTELRDRGISLTRKPLFLNKSHRPDILGILKEPYHTYFSQWSQEHNAFTES